jgi:predicted DNA-binding protein
LNDDRNKPKPASTTRLSIDLPKALYFRLQAVVRANGETKAAHVRSLILRDLQATPKPQ